MSWQHGEEWRWNPRYHHSTPTRTIVVIERAAADEVAAAKKSEGRRKVPFGFARVLQPEPEPLVWEGDGA